MIELLMKKLDYQIPSWQLKRRLKVTLSADGKSVEMMGVDSNGAPFTLFKDVLVDGKPIKKAKQPYLYTLPAQRPEHLNVELHFARHYEEPHVIIKVNMAELTENQSIEYMMVFDAAKTGKWELVLMHNQNKDMIGLAEFDQKQPVAEEKKEE